jgi:hypothetical protein
VSKLFEAVLSQQLTEHTRARRRPIVHAAAVLRLAVLLNKWLLVHMFVLFDVGFFRPGVTPSGGLSGGGITAAQTCAGVPYEQQFMAFKMVMSYCQVTYKNDPYCGGVLGDLIKSAVRQNIKTYGRADAHKHCKGKLFVALSALDPLATDLLKPKSWIVSNFTSFDDLVDVAGATDFLMCFSARSPYTVVRNTPVIDGGYSSAWAQFCPPTRSRCLKLAAYTVGPNNPTGKIPGPECALTATLPNFVGGKPLAAVGRTPTVPRDRWQLPTTCTYDPDTKAITSPQQPPFVPAVDPDIYPGFQYNSLKTDPCTWQSWALSLLKVTPEAIQAMYDQGAADADAWLAANPYGSG